MIPDVLNRYSDPGNPHHTTQILKYIFPRQFRLHNVFTFTVDPKETTQPFRDYTLREHEIAERAGHFSHVASHAKPHLPRRLRGGVFDLVQKLQKLHGVCAYYELLKHYYPLNGKPLAARSVPRTGALRNATCSTDAPESQVALGSTCTQPSRRRSGNRPSTVPLGTLHSVKEPPKSASPVVDFSTPVSNVSAFCRAVLLNLIPEQFWGQGVDGDHNKGVIMHNVDRFIRLRRFENLTLHAVLQDLKVAGHTATFKLTLTSR